MQLITSLIGWTKDTFAPMGWVGLFILSFIESSFFPIPPDVLLIVLCLDRPELSLFFAAVCTIGSILGGMFGYGIGYVGEEAFVSKVFSKKKIARAHKFFEKYGPWAVLVAAFSPIPYKVFTISAGLFYIDFKKFVIASAIGRAARFFFVATLVMLYGEMVLGFIEKYFNILTIAGSILLIAGYIIYRKFRKERRWQEKNQA